MKKYNSIITLAKNGRGCWILDAVKGCSAASHNCGRGCYCDCYSARIACRYGYDFASPVKRCFVTKSDQLNLFGFNDNDHLKSILRQISKIDMPFLRIGDSGDPSLCWEHTLDVCKKISPSNINIVIITKHWHTIPDKLYRVLEKLPITINTSVSALDPIHLLKRRLSQFNILKKACNSVLRIVSCEFNKENKTGIFMDTLQRGLFASDKFIDTVFRPTLNNPLVLNGVIKIKKIKFINSMTWASVCNDNTFTGKCNECDDFCGIYM